PVLISHSLIVSSALALAKEQAVLNGSSELMVIGGAQIYALALPQATRLYLTRVHALPVGDAFLPRIDWNDWQEVARQQIPATGNAESHTFLEYTRRTR
ncbi:MAG: dihydrofolate reductase, partial [Congregibacter sp.]|nr:dihydrofolate reductase [Congregibacter sp.]